MIKIMEIQIPQIRINMLCGFLLLLVLFTAKLLYYLILTTMDSARRPSFPADPFNFIKILASKDVKSARIKIPEEFTERRGGDLPEAVTLKVPNGDIWQVGLVNSKVAIWFNDGWTEFAEHYSLRFGHLLMFKYQGFLNFMVHIYEQSGCEIVYLKKNMNRQFAQSSCVVVNLDDSEAIKSDQDAEIKINGEGEGESESEGECSSVRVDGNGRKRALEAAKASFTSDKPFFMAYMT